jgi:hypothetical protein
MDPFPNRNRGVRTEPKSRALRKFAVEYTNHWAKHAGLCLETQHFSRLSQPTRVSNNRIAPGTSRKQHHNLWVLNRYKMTNPRLDLISIHQPDLWVFRIGLLHLSIVSSTDKKVGDA